MVLGDGIRRNVAAISPVERSLLRDALVELNKRVYPGERADPVPGGVTWWFKQDEIHKVTHVHNGPEFVPWHRVIVNRFEQLLRKINPQLSLHYWDWTQDPRAIIGANLGGGVEGTLNLFTPDFMGWGGPFINPIGEPWLSAGYYVPGANPHRDTSGNPADPPNAVVRFVQGGPASSADDDGIIAHGDYAQMWPHMRDVHDAMHNFVAMGGVHISFRDPFVFLLHSNVDRLFALWQTQPGHGERLDPDYIYGSESGNAALNGNVEPWSTGHSVDTMGEEHFIRPWSAPESEGVPRAYKHPAIVRPPKYDTNIPVHLPPAPDEPGGPAVTSGGPHRLDVFIRGRHNLELVHRYLDGGGWSGWNNLGGDLAAGPAVTSGGPHALDVFVRGKHHDELVHRYWNGHEWSGWINLGGDLASAPAVTSRGPHDLDVFVRGKHNLELVHRYLDGGQWSGWINLGGDLAAGPAVTSGGPHDLDVFVRGKHNDELVHRYLDGGQWSGWINLGGDLAAGPAVTSGGPHDLDVFVRGKHNDELVHRYLDGGQWSGWINLGGDLA
jgi:Common central domain of tyrosinase